MFNAQNGETAQPEAQGPSNAKIAVIAGLTYLALEVTGYVAKVTFNYIASKFKK